jgi:hypothetical protein
VDDQIIAIDFTVEEAAYLLVTANRVMGTLEAAVITEREYAEPLPRGMLTCGEACELVPALVVLLTRMHPQLVDTEALDQALRDGEIAGARGALN